jgi:PAS domain S-box-containing protein
MKEPHATESTKTERTRLKKHAEPLTSRKKTLSEQEKQLELIIDHIPALISYVDASEHYRFCNKLYEEWLGNTKESIYGKTMRQMRGSKVYNEIKPYVKKALAGELVSYDSSLQKKDGSIVYFTATYAPHFDAQGKVQGFFIHATDITDRKLAEDRLKERERQFRHLVDANVIGVVIKSLDGPIFEANDIFLKMVGYSREDLLAGKVNWRTMTPPEHLKNHNKYEKQILTRGAATPFEKEYIRKDGTRIPVLLGDVLLDRETRKTITFILDITKQKELDQRKDEFIALASHELKTPLTSLKMYAQLVKRQSSESKDKKSAHMLSAMDSQINKLTELVNDLLDVSRIQSGKLVYKKDLFLFDNLIEELVEELQPVATNHVIYLKGKTGQKIKGDKDRIKQVFTNLLTNAIKYSPKADKIIITLMEIDGSVQVSVQDFGLGVPKEQEEKIFERFFQVSRPLSHTYPGLGLGLYISKEIINRHGGKLWVRSIYGKGSTFYFTLPVADQSKVARKYIKPLTRVKPI